MTLAALLATLLAVSAQQKYTWKYNNLWCVSRCVLRDAPNRTIRTNPVNWNGNKVPTYGQSVVFPDIMSTFGSDSCDPYGDGSTIDPDCKIGTVISIDLSTSPAAQVCRSHGAVRLAHDLVQSIDLPTNGVLEFPSDGMCSECMAMLLTSQ